MVMEEKLQREGKIALLKQEIEELKVRIRNRQNTIRWTTSLVYSIEELGERQRELLEAVEDYSKAFDELDEKRDNLKRLEKEA